jgi:soluble cytochrome b562
MSVSGISLSSSLSQSSQNWQTSGEGIRTDFQKLGQDLQAGNLSQARSDFSAMGHDLPGSLQESSTASGAFSALRSAYHHHHYAGVGAQSTTSSRGNTLSQLFSSLGSALQAGNLSAAKDAYSTVEQDIEQLGWSAGITSKSNARTANVTG